MMFGRGAKVTLAEILNALGGVKSPQLSHVDWQYSPTQLAVDSRDVTEGAIFIALAGSQAHGIRFAAQAIDQGVKYILAEKSPGLVEMDMVFSESDHDQLNAVPVIWVDQLSRQCKSLASQFYQNPSQRVKVIGVTGTNGKTSTAHYIAQLLSATGVKVALLGTLGNGWIGDLTPSQNTTLEVVALNRWLAYFADQQADVVVMEVSSHAITLGRIDGIQFKGLALTQVTRDHLDFHKTEQAYQSVKKQLFQDYSHQFEVLNLDDKVGLELAHQNRPSVSQISYAKENAQADIFVPKAKLYQRGIAGQILLSQQPIAFDVPLMGEFNLENMLCAIGVCVGLGLTVSQLEKALNQLKPVAGRMQCLSHPGQATVVIDYAHTADALQALLIAVRAHLSLPNQQLWVVFGCGGNRDQGKRPLMGEVAQRYADKVVITDDNPRDESPEAIVQQITNAMETPFTVVHDRAQAVSSTLTQANPQDVVVIAGKGHESTQEIAGQKIPMQDERLVKQAYAAYEANRRPL
ncbi:UDP-N-acetylmuramoyl-L-alanyl-D-glutamate--2,6-diaminopimelate ligase [Hydrogenovibrio sp. SC-1]|uniref:UDP-N-acetylmuramoyl-L-alanyl-D-glutamate--2, 6-diaminopimelate ligase n=1 Tax=Hydrogenovibrio sp. SC-1 TaxID=2065820 RepID=UPI000C7CDAE9|nr:UDP-N-acetylmuramoyl-L-alanyl-D-glutamate--2,6-diaminopimelate ligase [Hydrogenovibrio sp. SC-1]PLA75141.1 UDP-N-acetylmuramoyl-L-alanyl-D-glutamate--2,6-diaminopimelate ligase [Hydrogenovibrio sp. SC-1]